MMASRHTLRLLVVGVWSALGAVIAAARGQQAASVRGSVRDSLGYPVVGAQVVVIGSPIRGETDERGEFLVSQVTGGRISVAIRRIGFRPDSVTIAVGVGQTQSVELVLHRIALDLQPVVILGRSNLLGPIAGFYDRRARGNGRFITRADIQRQNPVNLTDILRLIPGVRVESRELRKVLRFRGSECSPLTWLDGAPLYAGSYDFDALDPRAYEGIEIYLGATGVPMQFLGNRSALNSCGTVVLWSREGQRTPPRRKSGDLSAAALIARLVEQQTVFTVSQVDVAALPDSATLARPAYPDSLFELGVGGRVVAEFVVSAEGEVQMDTFGVVTSSHVAFEEAVRRAIATQRYAPARREGRAVQQLVQQPFVFVPDSAVVRKRARP